MARYDVFISYARGDRDPVRHIVDALNAIGIKSWVDSEQLMPGDSWRQSISEALREARSLIVFISPRSVKSKWIFAELEHAQALGILILPVIIEHIRIDELPPVLQRIQWLDASSLSPTVAANKIAESLARWSSPSTPKSPAKSEREELAKALAAQVNDTDAETQEEAPTSVFVVHGHDEDLLREVVSFVDSLGVEAIVLKDIGGGARSLIDRFFEVGGKARFAIILLSGDDMGASRVQFDEPEVKERALKYRARQNVILELGYFYGRLGWENVFVLEKEPPKKFPDFERPSDLAGVVLDRYDSAGRWKNLMKKRLSDHGFALRSPDM
jgi:predicted nucleotide-binding protein